MMGKLHLLFAVLALSVSALSHCADATPPAADATTQPGDIVARHPGGKPGVLLFVGSNNEVGIFDAVGGSTPMRIVEPARTVRALAVAYPFSDVEVVVWGRNTLRDLAADQISKRVQNAMKQFVQDGGDLVVFGQFGTTHTEFITGCFGVQVSGGCDGAQVTDDALRKRATAAGYDEAGLAKVRFYNSYLGLPPESAVLLRGNDEHHAATGAVVPFGHGRLILLGANLDPADQKLDVAFFDRIYPDRGREISAQPVAAQPTTAEAGDPMAWPAEPAIPLLRALLPPAEYQRRFRAARAAIDVDLLARPDRPTEGELVYQVDPGSRAEQLGLRVGDIVTAMDGVLMEDRKSHAPVQGPRTLTFWSPRGGMRTVQADDTPRFGFFSQGGWRPDQAYARSAERDPRWDDAMLVAGATFRDDPDLAETALQHAQQAGYEGRMLLPLAARIAFAECRFADCLAFGWQVLIKRGSVGEELALILYKAALLDFKLDQAIELAQKYPGAIENPEPIIELARSYRALPPDSSPSPIAMLSKLKRSPVVRLEGLNISNFMQATQALNQSSAEEFNKDGHLDLVIPSEHQHPMGLSPGFANIAVTVKFDCRQTDDQATRFDRCVRVALFNVKSELPKYVLPSDAIDVEVTDDGIEVGAFGASKLHFRACPPLLPERCRRTLCVVILHHRCEVTIDGRRIFYGPVLSDETKRQYNLFIQIVGLSGRVERPMIEELQDPREPQTIGLQR